jgi:hypothetical protein
MENQFESAWNQLSEVAKDLSQQCDLLAKLGKSMLDSSKKGDLHFIESRMEDLTKTAEILNQSRIALESELIRTRAETDSIEEIMRCVEGEIKKLIPDLTLYSIQSRMVVFPIVATFEKNRKGVRVTVGEETVQSNKPSFIVEFIRSELKRGFNPNNFVKSMYRAQEYLSRGQKNVLVSLEDIRQLLSLSRDTLNSYSIESFTHDLQRLYATTNLEFGTLKVELASAAAARQQFPIFLEKGNFINVAQIRFESIDKKETANEQAN